MREEPKKRPAFRRVQQTADDVAFANDPLEGVSRTPPNSQEAERGILSCIMQGQDELREDAFKISVECFYNGACRMIFDGFRKMNGTPFELASIVENFKRTGILENIGGPAALSELLSFTPSPSHYPHYKNLLRDYRLIRLSIEKASKVIQRCYSPAASFEESKADIMEEIASLSCALEEVAEKESTLAEQIDAWQDDWHQMKAGEKESAMASRWRPWNDVVGGLRPGYTIISGTSSCGKSTLLGNVMVDACVKAGRPGLLFSYEMPVRMVISRLVADIADVDGKHLFSPDKSDPPPHVVKSIAGALAEIRRSPLRIVHSPSMSVDGVCSIARIIFAKHRDIVVGVDYLQLIPRPIDVEKGSNREREVAVNSSKLRILSKELDRPVIALSQLSEDGTTRESKAINMDCDDHFKVDRHKKKKKGEDGRYYESDELVDRGVLVAKNRNGIAGVHIEIRLNGPKFRFQEKEAMP